MATHCRSRTARGSSPSSVRKHALREYLEIAAAFAILAGVVLALQQFALLPRGISVSDTMSYGLAFVIGLVASVSSCIAVTGGLLVAVAAKYNAANANLSDLERLKPHLYFNAGRLVSYTLLAAPSAHWDRRSCSRRPLAACLRCSRARS